jgi:two-component system, sensor histidine kinase and response regulator
MEFVRFFPSIKRVFLTITAIFCTTFAFSQSNSSDSLVSQLLNHTTLDTNRVKLLTRVGDALSLEGNFRDALTKVEDASNLSIVLEYTKGHADAMLYKGIIHYRMGDYNTAIGPLRLAITDFGMVPDQYGSALAYHWLGNSYYALSAFELALENYLRAYSIREAIQDKKGMSFTLSNIGNVYSDQLDYDKALDYNLKSLALKKEIGDQRSIATSYNNLGNVYSGLRQYDEAMKYYNDALAIFTALKNRHGIAYTLGSIGSLSERQGKFTEALKSLEEAAPILEQEGDHKASAEAYNHIGSIQRRIKLYSKAEESLLKAQIFAEQSQASTELIENYMQFAKLDSALGNMSQAFHWMKRHTTLKEKIFNNEKSLQIAQMQMAFDTERKDRTIQLLEKEKNYEESQKAIQRVIFASAVLVLLLLTVGLIYFLRLKHRANIKLKEQKAHSEELNRLKDKLFSIIAHDLRGPLNSLKGLLGLASGGNVSESEMKYLLGTIGQNTQYTSNLVDNLLMWAKDNLQGSTVTPQTFDLYHIVQSNLNLLQPQASLKRISISSTVKTGQLVVADENMIDLVFRNLLSNAIKFTEQGGHIHIGSSTSAQSINLFVKDDGVGISAEQLPNLFGTANISTCGTANEKGTGLGLILCKEFVEKNSGKIAVESIPGSGATFTITLPVAKVEVSSKNLVFAQSSEVAIA